MKNHSTLKLKKGYKTIYFQKLCKQCFSEQFYFLESNTYFSFSNTSKVATSTLFLILLRYFFGRLQPLHVRLTGPDCCLAKSVCKLLFLHRVKHTDPPQKLEFPVIFGLITLSFFKTMVFLRKEDPPTLQRNFILTDPHFNQLNYSYN